MSTSDFARHDQLVVKQQKEALEVFTDLESRNRYFVQAPDGSQWYAAETGDDGLFGFLTRSFLKAWRSYRMEMRDASGALVLRVERPFTFWLAETQVTDGEGRPLGRIQETFSLFTRTYDVEDAQGAKQGEIKAGFFRPRKFTLTHGGREVGAIQKQWGGGITEILTDADTFGVSFTAEVPPEFKLIALGATFLIDFRHFEDHG